MNNFIQRLKNLPWSSLLQSVALTYLIVAIAEVFTLWGITHSPAFKQIMLLLSAIILFDSDRPNVVHKDAIKLEQESYFYLLRRYLEAVVGGCQARSMFLRLINKVSELHILNDKHVRVYLDVNPKEVEPLLIEIFDLKNRR